MPTSYVPPGVKITEAVAPQVTPLISSTSETVLVGLSLGHQVRTDLVKLTGGSWVEKGKLTNKSKVVTNLKEVEKNGFIKVGQLVRGEHIPTGTKVKAILSETEVELTEEAEASGASVELTFEGEPTKLPFLAELPGSKLEKGEYPRGGVQVISATNPAEPSGSNGNGFKEYAEGSGDFVVNYEAQTIDRVSGGNIKVDQQVRVTYTYVPAGYYNPIRLFNFAEVQNRFGEALGEKNGEYSSPLSLGAQKAFEAGASNLILQPLFKLSSGTEPEYDENGFITNAEQPSNEHVAEASTWIQTLLALNTVEAIDLIVPVVGQGNAGGHVNDGAMKSIETALLEYEHRRGAEEVEIYGIFGEDGTLGEAKENALYEHARAFRSYAGGKYAAQNVLVNVTNMGISLPLGGEASIGGQYLAAAVAGALASRPVASSLTRKGINGFTKVKTIRTTEQKNNDAGEGLMVIEQIKGGQIRCRHAISLDTEHGASRSEVSVVRAKFLMVESVKGTLESQVIGQIIADGNSPIIVRSAIVGVLSALQSAGDLVDFTTPVCAIKTVEPTTITASFSYRPAFTLNYIDIVFSLDLSSQTVTLVETSQSGTLG